MLLLQATVGLLPRRCSIWGLRYCLGRDVPKDYVSAHKWFNLAALRGCEQARQYRAEISREMSQSEVAEAQRQARLWMTTH